MLRNQLCRLPADISKLGQQQQQQRQRQCSKALCFDSVCSLSLGLPCALREPKLVGALFELLALSSL